MKKTFGKLALTALLSIVPLSTAFGYSFSVTNASSPDFLSGLTTPESGVIVYDFDNSTPTYTGNGDV